MKLIDVVSKDLASVSLEEIRLLVDGYYLLQRQRIRIAERAKVSDHHDG